MPIQCFGALLQQCCKYGYPLKLHSFLFVHVVILEVSQRLRCDCDITWDGQQTYNNKCHLNSQQLCRKVAPCKINHLPYGRSYLSFRRWNGKFIIIFVFVFLFFFFLGGGFLLGKISFLKYFSCGLPLIFFSNLKNERKYLSQGHLRQSHLVCLICGLVFLPCNPTLSQTRGPLTSA